MFPGEEYLTLVSALALAASGVYVYHRNGSVPGLLWAAGGAAFAALAALLVLEGVGALESPLAPIVGSLYPLLLAGAALLSVSYRLGGGLLLAGLVLLMGIAVGEALGAGVLKGVAHGVLHSVSGVTLVAAPIYAAARMGAPMSALLASLGGLMISVGGVALAGLRTGFEILPAETVAWILHPLLAGSALLMALGYLLSGGFQAGVGRV